MVPLVAINCNPVSPRSFQSSRNQSSLWTHRTPRAQTVTRRADGEACLTAELDNACSPLARACHRRVRALPAAADTTASESAARSGGRSRDETYWARPVPGFGDPAARLLIVGLAPAAHGANRTGRVFTGDGAGGSGDFLMAALHRPGSPTQPTSRSARRWARTLQTPSSRRRCDARRRTTSRTPEEITNVCRISTPRSPRCRSVRVVVALGAIGVRRVPAAAEGARDDLDTAVLFGHGSIHELPNGLTLIGCYHPSRQNTNTGRRTGDDGRDVRKRKAADRSSDLGFGARGSVFGVGAQRRSLNTESQLPTPESRRDPAGP